MTIVVARHNIDMGGYYVDIPPFAGGFTFARLYNKPGVFDIYCQMGELALIDLQDIGGNVRLYPPANAQYGDIAGAMVSELKNPFTATFVGVIPVRPLGKYGEGSIIQFMPVVDSPTRPSAWFAVADILGGNKP